MEIEKLNTERDEVIMRYTTILLDADETLLDFSKTEERALRKSFEKFALPYEKRIHLLYHEINQNLWHEFSMGRMDKPTLTVRRFELLFDEIGVRQDVLAFKECYEGWIAKGFDTIAGAETLLQTLRGMGCALYCVTNGLKRSQYPRLTGAGLIGYFEKLFISEEAGSQKPQKEYFDFVFRNLSEKDKTKILLVGDSLTTDIQGGITAGLDTVWYNPTRAARPDGSPKPTYEAASLGEIPEIVRGAPRESEREIRP